MAIVSIKDKPSEALIYLTFEDSITVVFNDGESYNFPEFTVTATDEKLVGYTRIRGQWNTDQICEMLDFLKALDALEGAK